MNAFHHATQRSLRVVQRHRLVGLTIRKEHRCFSKDESSPSPFAQVKEAPGKSATLSNPRKRAPIPIHKTPRGQVAQRLGSKMEDEDTNLSSTSLSNDNIPMTNPDSHATTTTQHPSTHFIKGGVPCDPAPPPFRLADYGPDSLYTLVLLRHGESEWNRLNRYTGWCDVNLTERGRTEARDAGRLLKENGVELDHVFTSVLKRANFTTNMALNTAGQHWVPVTKSWRLNERHYGALQGYNKDTAWQELGIDQEFVMEMRRSYRTRPPRMDDDHVHWHGTDRRYQSLSETQLERSRAESLKDTADRILPFYTSHIVPSLQSGNKCLVVSHANTLRTLIKHIDNISDEDIKGMSIPTGIPLLYRLDKHMKPVDPNIELEFRYMVEPKGYTWATSHQHGFHGVYLGDLERLQDIQSKRDATNRDWQRIILRNVARQMNENLAKEGVEFDGVMEIRQLYFQIDTKMKQKEFGNMLLLTKMKAHLETLMWKRKQRYLTKEAFESILDKLHLDAEGHVVEPFENMACETSREKRAKDWFELHATELEEECLIK